MTTPRPDRRPQALTTAGALGLATILLTAGVAHFVQPKPFDAVMPRVIPDAAHRPLTYASGAAEIVLGAGLLLRRTRRRSAQAAAVLFLAVWPANIQAALDGGYPGLGGFAGSATAAWLRLPLQVPLIVGSWWVARHSPGAPRRP